MYVCTVWEDEKLASQCSVFLVAPVTCICVLIGVFNSIPETLWTRIVPLNTLTMAETFGGGVQ